MCGRQYLSCQGMTVQLPAGKKKSNISQADFYSLVGSLLNTWDIQTVNCFQEDICWFILAVPTPKLSCPQIPISRKALNRSADTSSVNPAFKSSGEPMGWTSSSNPSHLLKCRKQPSTQSLLQGLFCHSVYLSCFCCHWLKLFVPLLPFPFPHLNCHHGWQVLGAGIVSVHTLEVDTAGDLWRKEKGEPFSVKAISKPSCSSESFPTSQPKRVRGRQGVREFCLFFLTLFRITDSSKECTGLEFPSKLQNNVQNINPCIRWWVPADQVYPFKQQCPLPYCSTL